MLPGVYEVTGRLSHVTEVKLLPVVNMLEAEIDEMPCRSQVCGNMSVVSKNLVLQGRYRFQEKCALCQK